MLKGGLVLIWELDMNLELTLMYSCGHRLNSFKRTNSRLFYGVWVKFKSDL